MQQRLQFGFGICLFSLILKLSFAKILNCLCNMTTEIQHWDPSFRRRLRNSVNSFPPFVSTQGRSSSTFGNNSILTICLQRGEKWSEAEEAFYNTSPLAITSDFTATAIWLNSTKSVENLNACDVLLRPKGTSTDKRLKCPGNCHPTPVVEMNYNITSAKDNDGVLCSLTVGMIRDLAQRQQIKSDDLFMFAITRIAITRMQECSESANEAQPSTSGSVTPLAIPKRPIKYLILFIGSVTRSQLMMEQQVVIPNNPFDGASSTIVWMATEELYNCDRQSTECEGGYFHGDLLYYHKGFPHTEMYPNATLWISKTADEYIGWSCAQRRPLRALAHALLLFDPSVVLMVDDDTFVNWELMKSVTTELNNLDTPLSPTGFGVHVNWPEELQTKFLPLLLGGGGYMLGQHAIARLTGYGGVFKCAGFYENECVDFFEGVLASVESSCTEKCIAEVESLSPPPKHGTKGAAGTKAKGPKESQPPEGRSYQLKGRLVDMCRNYLSGEHTCYHRCGIYKLKPLTTP